MPPTFKIVEIGLLVDPEPAIASTLTPSAKLLSSHEDGSPSPNPVDI
jgi:hypothetical protein